MDCGCTLEMEYSNTKVRGERVTNNCRAHIVTDGGYCGDGALAVYEDCDDANSIPLDGCNDCVREYCGDLIVNNNGTETCDGGDDCPLTCICNSTISEADPETPGACRPRT